MKALEYLQQRGISEKTITSARNIELTDNAVIAHYQHIDGKREFKQYLNLDGSKAFEKGSKCSDNYFFACGAKTKDAEKIVVMESVIDALSVADVMPEVASLATGGSTLYKKLNALPYKEKIVLAFDNDEPGRDATRNTIKLLGEARIIPWRGDDPKDFNELLKEGKRERIRELIDGAYLVGKDTFEENTELTAATESAPEETNPLLKYAISAQNIQEKFEKTLTLSWIIKDILPEAANLSIIYGNYATYKSFLIMDMLLCIATGKNWHGKKTRKKNCVYITGEGEAGTAKRFVAWQIANNTKVMENFTHVGRAAIIDDPEEFTHIADLIAKCKPEIVVFDTLARSMLGDENSTKDMNRVINNLDKLTQDYGCKFILIHHSGKDKSRGARGNSALLGAVDVAIETISRNKNEVIIRCEKMKDAEPFSEMGFRMEVASTGFATDEGDPINSLVPKYDPDIKRSQEPLSKQAQIALDALTPGKKISVEEWRDLCFLAGISDSKKENTKYKAFKRAKEILEKENIIKIEDDYVFLL
jgi:hypothetical protein